MTSETISFNEEKAARARDPRLWSVLECLKALVRDLESGKFPSVDGVYVAMLRKDENGNATGFPYYCAGASTLELRGMLTQHLYDICDYSANGS